MPLPFANSTAAPPRGPGRPRPAPLAAEVVRVEQRSLRMRRIVLGGGQLDQFTWPGAGSHLKLLLPQPGEELALPTPAADGTAQLDRSRLVVRTYTPRSWDAGSQELSIDMFLHGDGPASTWASRAAAGDKVAVSRPRAHYDIDPEASWLLLAGDESAAPAIGTILDARTSDAGTEDALESDTPCTVVLEAEGDDLELGLPAGAEARVVTSHPAAPGAALLEALRAALPTGDISARSGSEGCGRVWVAGEARGIRTIRSYLLGERGLPSNTVVTRGYWRQGESDHPDHDHGEDGDGGRSGPPPNGRSPV